MRKSPFKFLDSFTLKDRDSFFGRDVEVEALYNMVFESPLTLIYGLSGTGKTSLVQCGLASQFDGPDWFPFFIRRNENINASLNTALDECIEKEDQKKNLTEKISYLTTKYLRPVYLIFDQFEELFILNKEKDNRDEQNKFIQNIKDLIDAKLHCKIIFIIREEYLGHLYDFENVIPYIFDYRLRVEPMNVKMTTQVLFSSFDKFNISLSPLPEEDRTQQIIDNISDKKSGIQLPYLQVYLDGLYREDFERTYPNGNDDQYPPLEFTEKEIADFGRIDDVLDNFLEEQKEELLGELKSRFEGIEENTLDNILDTFVTSKGTKRPIYFEREDNIIHLHKQFEQFLPKVSRDVLSYSIKSLEKRRILRFTNATTFELAHDSLAGLIDQQRTEDVRQRNDAMRNLIVNYGEFEKNQKHFLTADQLERYKPFFPKLRLDDQLQKFIESSKQDAKLKEKKERLAQSWKRWLLYAGLFAIISSFVSYYFYTQRKYAEIEAEKRTDRLALSNITTYKKHTSDAIESYKEGNYLAALTRISFSKTYYDSNDVKNLKDRSIITDSKIDFLEIGHLDSLKNSWVEINILVEFGDSLYQIATDEYILKYDDLELKGALKAYEAALLLNPQNETLQEKISNIKIRIDERREVWIKSALSFINYNQCFFSKDAIDVADSLDIEKLDHALIDSLKIQIQDKRRDGICYPDP